MNINMIQFLSVLLLTVGLGLILAGLFTAYFGRGKSRMVGISLTVIGLLLGLLTWLAHEFEVMGAADGYYFMDLIWMAVQVIGAFVIGAIITLGIFLLAIMKT